jgi:hypothetical protein
MYPASDGGSCWSPKWSVRLAGDCRQRGPDSVCTGLRIGGPHNKLFEIPELPPSISPAVRYDFESGWLLFFYYRYAPIFNFVNYYSLIGIVLFTS